MEPILASLEDCKDMLLLVCQQHIFCLGMRNAAFSYVSGQRNKYF